MAVSFLLKWDIMELYYTKITKDNRCLDLLLTEDELVSGVKRALDHPQMVDKTQCCSCWSVEKPPKCNFWSKILGLCKECNSWIFYQN